MSFSGPLGGACDGGSDTPAFYLMLGYFALAARSGPGRVD